VSVTQALAIALLAVPTLALVLWPLFARGGHARPAWPDEWRAGGGEDDAASHRRHDLTDEKGALYRALRELGFERDAGHLSEEDYAQLCARYEARAAEVLAELDTLGPEAIASPDGQRGPISSSRVEDAERARMSAAEESAPAATGRGWTRHPAVLGGGALFLLVFGVVMGLGIGRFTEPDPSVVPPGSRLPVRADPGGVPPAASTPGAPGNGARAIPPEMLAGMLRAARESLVGGRYQEAIAAYQAVLKRDARNVDAMTHLGLIVAIGGHPDAALETFDRALAIDPAYAPALLYRGQVLYEVKRDYPGAAHAWEQYLALAPPGEERDRVQALLADALAKAPRTP
jgi:tetratricopeptide (TPR) repeat protein